MTHTYRRKITFWFFRIGGEIFSVHFTFGNSFSIPQTFFFQYFGAKLYLKHSWINENAVFGNSVTFGFPYMCVGMQNDSMMLEHMIVSIWERSLCLVPIHFGSRHKTAWRATINVAASVYGSSVEQFRNPSAIYPRNTTGWYGADRV